MMLLFAMLNRQKLLIFNKTNLCSGELFESKFVVPCNPEEYLSFQYGKDKWKIPNKDYHFNLDAIKFYKTWNDQEWPFIIRWYDVHGNLDELRTIDAINEHAKVPILKLPQEYENETK
jgi:hypothetical protein